MRILYIEASPRKQQSASIQVARAFLAEWQARDPGTTVDTIDVWALPLPEFDGAALEGKYAGIAGRPLTAEQDRAWTTIRELAARFLAADLILIGTPMWNYGVPYKLKHLIDLISHKDILFRFDAVGSRGMVTAATVVVIGARGSGYSTDMPAESYDFQLRYLQTWTRMIGIADFRTVLVEKTFNAGEVDEASRAAASAESERLAAAVWAEYESRLAGLPADAGS